MGNKYTTWYADIDFMGALVFMNMLPYDTSRMALIEAISQFRSEFLKVIRPWVALNILSLVLSVFVAVIFIAMFILKRKTALKPSFRLSAWIAVIDALLATKNIAQMYHMDRLHIPSMKVRLVEFSSFFTNLSFVFLTCCIVLDLQLTILHNKAHWAAKINPFYEAFSFIVALLLSQPYFYTGSIIEGPIYQMAALTAPKLYIWGCFYIWILLGLLYCFVACVALVAYLFLLSKKTKPLAPAKDPNTQQVLIDDDFDPLSQPPTPIPNSSAYVLPVDQNGQYRYLPNQNKVIMCDYRPSNVEEQPRIIEEARPRKSITTTISTSRAPKRSETIRDINKRHRWQLRLTILRVMLFPIILVLVNVWKPLIAPQKFGYTIIYINGALLSLQGALNFIAFIVNPGLDEIWESIKKQLYNQQIFAKEIRQGLKSRYGNSKRKDLFL